MHHDMRPAPGRTAWWRLGLLTLWMLLLSSLPVLAQTRSYRIGVLSSGFTFQPTFEGFRAELARLGYVEGLQLRFLIEDAQGDITRVPTQVASLITAAPDLLFTGGTTATVAAKQATTTLPIVFAFVADPLRAGLVASHVSSHNNLTGISNHAGTLLGKRLEILHDLLPSATRLLVFVTPSEQVSVMSFEDLSKIAPALGIALVRRDVTTWEEVVQVLATLPAGSIDAVFYIPSSLIGAKLDTLIQHVRVARLPLIGHDNTNVQQGALMSYGADFHQLGRQAARLAVKIMQGAKPADLPIQTPETLSLAVNVTTARTLGLKLSRQVLENADLLVE